MLSEYTVPEPDIGTGVGRIVAFVAKKVTAIGGKRVSYTSLVYSVNTPKMVVRKGGIAPIGWSEGPRGGITLCTAGIIVADVFPTSLPVSTVTKIADPEVVDKVVGPGGSLGVPLGIAGALAGSPKEAFPGPVPGIVTVVVQTGGPVFGLFVVVYCCSGYGSEVVRRVACRVIGCGGGGL